MRDRMLHIRYELKYRLTKEQALNIRDFIQGSIIPNSAYRFSLDEFSVGKPKFSYSVHSLYLDSDDLKTYWDTINGNKNRFKLRLRYYDIERDSPVFFEIKRRLDRSIHKERGAVSHRVVSLLLDGHFPEEDHLVSKSPKQLVALQRFCESMQQLRAWPKVHVAYEREAYVSDDDSHRVTIDRHVRAEPNLDLGASPNQEGVLKTEMKAPVLVFGDSVILELKFTNRFPNWFRELVEHFDLMQCSAAKYVDAVSRIGHQALGCPIPVESEALGRRQPLSETRFEESLRRRRRFPRWVNDLE